MPLTHRVKTNPKGLWRHLWMALSGRKWLKETASPSCYLGLLSFSNFEIVCRFTLAFLLVPKFRMFRKNFEFTTYFLSKTLSVHTMYFSLTQCNLIDKIVSTYSIVKPSTFDKKRGENTKKYTNKKIWRISFIIYWLILKCLVLKFSVFLQIDKTGSHSHEKNTAPTLKLIQLYSQCWEL